jgi:hypothetical protein
VQTPYIMGFPRLWQRNYAENMTKMAIFSSLHA